jgi:hypothetical protein
MDDETLIPELPASALTKQITWPHHIYVVCLIEYNIYRYLHGLLYVEHNCFVWAGLCFFLTSCDLTLLCYTDKTALTTGSKNLTCS